MCVLGDGAFRRDCLCLFFWEDSVLTVSGISSMFVIAIARFVYLSLTKPSLSTVSTLVVLHR